MSMGLFLFFGEPFSMVLKANQRDTGHFLGFPYFEPDPVAQN